MCRSVPLRPPRGRARCTVAAERLQGRGRYLRTPPVLAALGGGWRGVDDCLSGLIGYSAVSIRQGDVVSHYEMCQAERRNLQQGMNFRPGGRRSVILMSLRKGAPYADRIEEGDAY